MQCKRTRQESHNHIKLRPLSRCSVKDSTCPCAGPDRNPTRNSPWRWTDVWNAECSTTDPDCRCTNSSCNHSKLLNTFQLMNKRCEFTWGRSYIPCTWNSSCGTPVRARRSFPKGILSFCTSGTNPGCLIPVIT